MIVLDPDLKVLRAQLSSREHMQTTMATHGAKAYWAWRTAALELTKAPQVAPSVAYQSDFAALLSAYDLLHTLSRETELEPDEQSILLSIKTHIHQRSTLAQAQTPLKATPPKP